MCRRIWAAAAVCFLRSFSVSAAQAAAPAQEQGGANFPAFKPGIAVMIAVLTMFICITFLVLLYARQCNAGRGGGGGGGARAAAGGVSTRKNSGVSRALVESLPVFRFGSLRGQKQGLECAVCLSRFESTEALRLLPKCKHAFHVECVDTWLDAHSTCPLCRYRVSPEDLLLVVEPVDDSTRRSFADSIRRISGRHSSAGERGERKDGLLLKPAQRKVEHRIIVSGAGTGPAYERWSDVLPSDLLYLRSELLINGRSASDAGGDQDRLEAGRGATWTAWISQPTDVRSLALTPS